MSHQGPNIIIDHSKISCRNQYIQSFKKCTEVTRVINKKVLLRERKRHTARRVAIAGPCYSGGGVPWQKFFFPSLNVYQAQSGVKNFSGYWGRGGSLDKKFFSQSEHVSSQIWCQKFFPLLRPGTPPDLRPTGYPPPDLRLGTPHLDLDLGPPLPGPGTPPTWTWTWDPPLWTDTQTGVKTLPSRRTTYAGGNNM